MSAWRAAFALVALSGCLPEASESLPTDDDGPASSEAVDTTGRGDGSLALSDTFSRITRGPFDTIFAEAPFEGSYAGPCDLGWPGRIRDVFEVSILEMDPTDGCVAVVDDFTGDGLPDAALAGLAQRDSVWILVLDGAPPQVAKIADRSRYDALQPMEPGRHELCCCFPDGPVQPPDTLADRIRDFNDGVLTFSNPGFVISFNEKYALYFHFADGWLHEELGSGC